MFDPNKKVFDTYAQKVLYRKGVMLTPKETALKHIEKDYYECFNDYYDFVYNMYETLYERPEILTIDSKMLDDNLHNLNLQNAFTVAKEKKQTERLEILKVYNSKLSLPNYIITFLISHIDFNKESYFLSKADYKKFYSYIRSFTLIDRVKFVEIFEQLKIKFNVSKENTVLSSSTYPGLFKALKIIREKTEKDSNSKKLHYVYRASILDFSFFNPCYDKYDISDYFYCMSDEEKCFIKNLVYYLGELGLNTYKNNSIGIVLECMYNNKTLFTFRYDVDNPEVFIGCIKVFRQDALACDKLYKTDYLLKLEEITNARKDSVELIKFFKKNRNACRCCGIPPCCGNVHPKDRGYCAHVFGEIRKICCGYYRIRIRKFNDNNLKYAKEFIDIIMETEKSLKTKNK